MWFVPHLFLWGPIFCDSVWFMWVWSVPSFHPQLQRGACDQACAVRALFARTIVDNVGRLELALFPWPQWLVMGYQQNQTMVSEQCCLFLWYRELQTQYKLELLVGHLAWLNEGISLFGEDEPNMQRKAKLRESPNHTVECLDPAKPEGLALGLCCLTW